jgi:hypothetical protein
MSTDLDFIRDCARRGHSFNRTAQLVGFDYSYQLKSLLESLGVNDIEWPNPHRCLARQEQLARLHESRRGKPQSELFPKPCIGSRHKAKKYTAFGVTGTLPELVSRFGKVSLQSVRYRMKNGMSIEDALETQRQNYKKGVIPPQFMESVARHQKRAAARRDEAISRRLTPAMLQFREETHDIVVTRRHSACRMVVEVREKGSKRAIHRLDIPISFDSGVLFAFNPVERGRLDFIAFEPDHKALV